MANEIPWWLPKIIGELRSMTGPGVSGIAGGGQVSWPQIPVSGGNLDFNISGGGARGSVNGQRINETVLDGLSGGFTDPNGIRLGAEYMRERNPLDWRAMIRLGWPLGGR